MEDDTIKAPMNITITEVLSLAAVWVAILLTLQFINNSAGVTVLGLAAGYHLSKAIILKRDCN